MKNIAGRLPRQARTGSLRRGVPALCLLGAAAWISGCDKPEAEGPQSPVLAEVAGIEITADALRQEAAYRASRGRTVPDKDQLLEEMIQRRALLVRAAREGIDQDPEVRRSIENRLIAALRDERLEPKIRAAEVTDADVETAYQRDREKYEVPAKVRVALLYRVVNESTSEESREKIREDLAEAVRQYRENPPEPGRDPASQGFGQIAVNASEDQTSRYRGGDVGWLDEGDFNLRWPREVLETAYNLEKGEISEILELKDGFYVVMRSDERPPSTRALAQVRRSLQRDLLRERHDALREDFLTETVETADPKRFPDALEQVELNLPPAGPEHENVAPPVLPGGAAMLDQ